MEHITGIGGFFFRSENAKELILWYIKHLGINPTPKTYDERSWWQEGGPTEISAYSPNDSYLGKFGKSWVINFRVKNLDAMIEQLNSAGIEVELDPEVYPNGRFAFLVDPEGNPIQLWEVVGPDKIDPKQR